MAEFAWNVHTCEIPATAVARQLRPDPDVTIVGALTVVMRLSWRSTRFPGPSNAARLFRNSSDIVRIGAPLDGVAMAVTVGLTPLNVPVPIR